jgi:hypothetical protein
MILLPAAATKQLARRSAFPVDVRDVDALLGRAVPFGFEAVPGERRHHGAADGDHVGFDFVQIAEGDQQAAAVDGAL